eukprot:2729075-Alexandrium_andersonii.AAC.1
MVGGDVPHVPPELRVRVSSQLGNHTPERSLSGTPSSDTALRGVPLFSGDCDPAAPALCSGEF